MCRSAVHRTSMWVRYVPVGSAPNKYVGMELCSFTYVLLSHMGCGMCRSAVHRTSMCRRVPVAWWRYGADSVRSPATPWCMSVSCTHHGHAFTVRTLLPVLVKREDAFHVCARAVQFTWCWGRPAQRSRRLLRVQHGTSGISWPIVGCQCPNCGCQGPVYL